MNIATEPRDEGRRQFALNAAASWLANGIKALLQLALLPVMAHLLSPNDYGVYALAQPTLFFFVIIADSGIGVSLAREDERNTLVWSTAFWVLMASFSMMALGVVGSGFVLAAWTGQHQLIGLMAVLSLSLPLIALSIPCDARLASRGNLTLHAWGDISGSVSSAAVAVTLAYYGYGVWSLAVQYLTACAVRAIILNVIAFRAPRLEFNLSALRDHLGMGGALLVRRIGEFIARSAENAIFERVFGAALLGSYSIATQTSRFACDVVANPTIAALYSHALRSERDEVRALHARLERILLLLLLPAATLAAITASRLLPLVLGPRWGNAAAMFQPIVVCYAILSIAGLLDPILMRNDMTKRATVPALIAAVARIGAVALGPWLGSTGVAWLIGGVFLIHALSLTASVPAPLTEGLLGALQAHWVPAIGTLVAATVATVLLTMGNGATILVGAIIGGAAAYAVTVWAISGTALRSEAKAVLGVVRRERRQRRGA